MTSRYKNIIWDWNGTLLNDISICIRSMNILLNERVLPLLDTNRYREIFTFPVQVYYEQLGFDFTKEEFDKPALKFIDLYKEFLPNIGLFPEVEGVLEKFHNRNLSQFILSAMEQESLLESVQNLNIAKYFDEIVGIDDHFARSKVDRGKYLIEKNGFDKTKTVMIGDTLHDMEVAEILGIDCILVSQGHQNIERLKINGNQVVGRLQELLTYL